jgi:hypothetical protein
MTSLCRWQFSSQASAFQTLADVLLSLETFPNM